MAYTTNYTEYLITSNISVKQIAEILDDTSEIRDYKLRLICLNEYDFARMQIDYIGNTGRDLRNLIDLNHNLDNKHIPIGTIYGIPLSVNEDFKEDILILILSKTEIDLDFVRKINTIFEIEEKLDVIVKFYDVKTNRSVNILV